MSERISKEEEKAFKSGCMCFPNHAMADEFAERLRKQNEEDARTGYVEENVKPKRISKSMEKTFKSGCMCFFDHAKHAAFAERLRKQKEEDARTGYVEEDVDSESSESDEEEAEGDAKS